MRRLSLADRFCFLFFPGVGLFNKSGAVSFISVPARVSRTGTRHFQRVANMAVNFPSIDPAHLHPVAGVTLGWAEANIRKPNRKDVLVIQIEEGATVGGVFTSNRFCAAPVTVCREHLEHVRAGGKGIRALVVNTGNANAGTGEPGLAHARGTGVEPARLAGIAPEQVLPFSTGVILEPLPVDRLKAGLPAALTNR